MVLAEHADLIFAISNVLFSLALAPSLWKRAGVKMPLLTSAMTGGLLFVLGATFADLGFAFSAMTLTISGFLWGILMYQRVVYLRRTHWSFRSWVSDMVTRLRLRLPGH